jgi:sugar lactone lactonase YvrE
LPWVWDNYLTIGQRNEGDSTVTRLLLALASIAAVAVSAAGAQNAFPNRIDLPDGFQPEGIATAGERFYVGSIPTGAVYRGSLRTGEGAVLVAAQAGRAAIGLKVDRGRLFVAGGPTGNGYVYNANSGALITTYALSTGGSFINDVVVTKRAAWFTDSFKAVLYRVPLGPNGRPGAASSVTTVPLTGDYVHGGGFNVNGIDATANGKTVIFVQSGTGKLFTTGANGVARAIALTGPGGASESVPSGDGLLLDGRTLYVVQNQLNVVAKISLGANLRSGRVLTRIANPDLQVPTTIAEHGSRLYAVNARFGNPTPATADYWVTQLKK